MGQMMMSTLVPLYAHDLGATAYAVGLVAGAFAVTALLLRPFLGPAFDAYSKKKLLVIALGIICAATYLYGMAQSAETLFAARLLHGAGMACASPAALALVGDMLPDEKMSSGMSVYGLAFALAQALGPAMGLAVLDVVGYSLTFRMATVLMVVAFVLALVLKEPKASLRIPYKLELSRMFAKEALIPGLLMGLLALSFSCIGSFIVIYGQLLDVEGMGYYFIVYSLCLLASRPLFGVLSDRLGPDRVIPVGIVLFGAAMVMIARADCLEAFLAAALVGAFGYGAVHPLLQSLSMLCTPPEHRGSASNTTFIGVDVGYLAGPTLGGMVVEVFGELGRSAAQSYSHMFLTSLIPVAVAMAVFLLAQGHLSRLMSDAKRGDCREACD